MDEARRRATRGMSASDFIRSGGTTSSKDRKGRSNERQQMRKPRQAPPVVTRILDPVTRSWSWRLAMETGEARVEVRSVPEMHVAYLRHVGPYAGDNALFGRLFGQLFSWAGPRGLVGPDTMVLSIYQDDPDITEEERLRVDVALTVPAVSAAVASRTIIRWMDLHRRSTRNPWTQSFRGGPATTSWLGRSQSSHRRGLLRTRRRHTAVPSESTPPYR